MNEKTFKHIVLENDSARIDQTIAKNLADLSRTQIKTLIKQGYVKCNNLVINDPNFKVNLNDFIEIKYLETRNIAWQPSNVELNIIYEDEHLLVIDKPAGLVMHPGAGQSENTVANALLYLYQNSINVPRAGIVHRLDKDTSGVCICAKTNEAYLKLTKAIKKREISRKYQALVHGEIFSSGQVNEPIGRHARRRTAMAVTQNGRPALTNYYISTKYKMFTWLELELDSGRTHQIRVHMSHINHPIVGDKLYNKSLNNYSNIKYETILAIQQLNRQALHACAISFLHPFSKEEMIFKSKISPKIANILATLDLKYY